MIIKNVLRTMALVAAVATAAFMTGCGDDDNDNNNPSTAGNAPATSAPLVGKTFSVSPGGGGAPQSFQLDSGTHYIYNKNDGTPAETGGYTYSASGNVATITTQPDAGLLSSTITVTFSPVDANGQYSGNISALRQGESTPSTGTFQTTGTNPGDGGTDTNTPPTLVAPPTITGKNYLVNGGTNGTVTISFPNGTTYAVAAGGTAVETGTYTYTASTTTNTAVIQLNPTTAGVTPNTLNLTFTSVTVNAETGTVSESDGVNGSFTQTGSTGINPGGGTTTAPTALHSLHVISTGGPFVGADYTVTLSGNGTSGTFDIGGGSTGSGTYTYTANGNNGTLILNYTSENAVGDNDTMVLAFSSASGGNFTGSQTTGGVQHNDFTGTFDSAN